MAVTQISRSQGRELRENPGFVLRRDAAIAWDNAVRAFGKDVLLTGAWRSYETQERLFRERYEAGAYSPYGDYRYWKGQRWGRVRGAAAAVPGTSNHGGGVAVDVKTRRYDGDPAWEKAVVFTAWGDKDRKRFLKEAAKFGWYDDEGRRVNELWHLTYYPSRDQYRGKVIKPKQDAITAEDGFTMTSKSEFTSAIIDALKSGEGRKAVAQAFTIDGVMRAPSDTDPDNAYWTLEGYLRSIRSTAQRAEARAEEAKAAAKASKAESEALARDIAELRDALAAHDQKG